MFVVFYHFSASPNKEPLEYRGEYKWGCMCLCQKISLTAKPIWFSFPLKVTYTFPMNIAPSSSFIREGAVPRVPRVLCKGFHICWLNNFWDFFKILICLLIKMSIQTFQPLIVIHRRDNFVIIIGDIHQFIGHCLIPYDPLRVLCWYNNSTGHIYKGIQNIQ